MIEDVAPDGFAYTLGSFRLGALRTRFRNGFVREELMEPGKVEELTIRHIAWPLATPSEEKPAFSSRETPAAIDFASTCTYVVYLECLVIHKWAISPLVGMPD
jgi:predicted acyl esterase